MHQKFVKHAILRDSDINFTNVKLTNVIIGFNFPVFNIKIRKPYFYLFKIIYCYKKIQEYSNKMTPSVFDKWLSESSNHALFVDPLILYYTYRGDSLLNNALRKNYLPYEMVKLFHVMLEIMEDSQDIPNCTLYRGLDNPQFASMNIDDIIYDKGFSSFSLNETVAHRFTANVGVILVLHVDQSLALKGIHLDISLSSSFYMEEEIILGPGFQFKIINKWIEDNMTFLEIKIVGQDIPDFPIVDNIEKMITYHKKIQEIRTPTLIKNYILESNYEADDMSFRYFLENRQSPNLWLHDNYIYNLYQCCAEKTEESPTDIYLLVNYHTQYLKETHINNEYRDYEIILTVRNNNIRSNSLYYEFVNKNVMMYTIQKPYISDTYLVDYIDIDTFDSTLVESVIIGNKELVKEALQKGEDINDPGLLDLCIRLNKHEIALILINAGAIIYNRESEIDNRTMKLLRYIDQPYEITTLEPLLECPEILEYLLQRQNFDIASLLQIEYHGETSLDDVETYQRHHDLFVKQELIKIAINYGISPRILVDGNPSILLLIVDWETDDPNFLTIISDSRLGVENFTHRIWDNYKNITWLENIERNKIRIGTVFQKASENRNYWVCQYLLDNDYDFTVSGDKLISILGFPLELLEQINEKEIKGLGKNLLSAILHNRYDIVNFFLQFGPEIDAMDIRAEISNWRIVDLLLNYSGLNELYDEFYLAIDKGAVDTIKVFLNNGTYDKIYRGYTAENYAKFKKEYEIAEILHHTMVDDPIEYEYKYDNNHIENNDQYAFRYEMIDDEFYKKAYEYYYDQE